MGPFGESVEPTASVKSPISGRRVVAPKCFLSTLNANLNYLQVLAACGGNATPRESRFIVSIFCAENLSLSLQKLYFSGLSFVELSLRTP